ncbi:hypothetical protein [Lysobacter sp. CA199]|uniref:hypothetical protein n=1 Tax=Lysobacter sp. CA199 TaxID=3455608 RepID=UPI003F8D0F06
MKTLSMLCVSLLGMALATAAQAQSSAETQLRQAATGASFKIGDTQFRLAPSAVVSPATAASDPAQTIVGGKYAVSVDAADASPRSKRSAAADAPSGKLAAAVSESGVPAVVTSSINVYFNQPSVLADAVRATGGKLTYSSDIGGKGTIEFGSVAEAFEAVGKLQGKAGIKEVSPQIEQLENILL